ncbi:MAG: helix-turn-helix transcriptional regulator [Kiritimatiellae bacterium]|nr:helix-turn-helix transcriptional regulator [Kiritimatiellia bacterium]
MKADQLRLIYAGHIEPDPRWRSKVHAHPDDEIVAVTQGRLFATVEERREEAQTGDVLLWHKGIVHQEISAEEEPVEFYYARFSGELDVSELPARMQDTTGRIRLMLRWLYEEARSLSPNKAALCASYLRALVAEYERARFPAESRLVSKVRRFVCKNLARDLQLKDLAECAGMSAYHFARMYRTAAGMPPMQDVRRLRVRHAQELIETTDLPLKVVAAESGLGDAHNLSRVFKKCLGTPPGSLRG